MTAPLLNRQHLIEDLACKGDLEGLKELLGAQPTQLELDVALGDAVAYSRIQTAEFLLSQGARLSHYNYDGVYYAVHNNEIGGLEFAISKGVDVNVNDEMLLNTSIVTALNTSSTTIVRWLLDHGADTGLLTKESLALVDRYGKSDLRAMFLQSSGDL